VLAYGLTAFVGDIANGCAKTASDWYHAPWMTIPFGASPDDLKAGRIGAGREPICGLTQERSAPVGFLHKKQDRIVQNWAVGTFNAPGGVLLGRIWRDKLVPNLSETKFPAGTFIIKYLFTEANDTEVPYLAGSPVWQASIYERDGSSARQIKPMRLAQIDFGIRDPRMDSQTGWVYGTFLYANSSGNAEWRKNLVPVGVMWGNDPGVTVSTQYKEQVLHPRVVGMRDRGELFDLAVRKDFGWFDRVNGPIDNPASSCLSCHGTAQVHKTKIIKHFLTPALAQPTDSARMLWFKNIKPGDTFVFSEAELKLLRQGTPSTARADWTPQLMSEFVSTDYSLQVRMGIETARAFAMQQSLQVLELAAPKQRFSVTATPTAQKLRRDLKKESLRVERTGTTR
jgi:hypothetical protein